MSAKNEKLDRDALHAYLYQHTDVHGKVRVVQKLLADMLDVTHYTVSRILKEFVIEGRIKKLGKDKHNISIYVVTDPQAWAGGKPAPKAKQILWG